MTAERRAYPKLIDGDLVDEIVRRKPMAGGRQAGVRTGGATQPGSLVKLWKLTIS
jgi:hypothetical protein